MGTFFDDASLVMIPSGVKESKLYSIKPTDGTGDFTFTRGTDTATRVNSAGLIEKETQNLLTYSNDFGNAAWNKVRASVTSGATDPFGGSNAWSFLTDTTADDQHYFYQSISQSGVGTLSIYAKSNGYNWLRLRLPSEEAFFDLANGVTGSSTTGISASMTDAGNGWYRCEVAISDMSSNPNVFIHIAEGDGDIIIGGTPSGSDGLYIYAAQLEQSLVARAYIDTTTAAVYAGITDNLPRLDYTGGASCPSLLLEPQRTNILENSEYFSGSDWINNGVTITDNAAISPEGKTNAALLTGVSGGFGIVKFSTWTATNKAASCFAKSGSGNILKIANVSASNRYVLFDLSDGTISEESTNWTGSIEDFGNGWYRCTAISNGETGTFSLGTTAASDSIYIYGAQLEAGGYPTSYIPTYGGSSVTRSVDSCVATSVSDIIGQTQGTLFMDADFIAGNGEDQTILIGVSGYNDYVFIQMTSGNRVEGGIIVNSTEHCRIGEVKPSGRYKCAFAYANNDFVFYINGEQIGVETSGSMSGFAVDFINLNFNNKGYSLNNHSLFKTRLSNADLATLTTI